jgi:hypothetical protein
MSYSRQQAEAALNDAERAEQRATILRGYERNAPNLILWGVIWIIGYGLSDVLPRWSGVLWIVLSVSGLLCGYWISRRAANRGRSERYGWRYLAVGMAMFAFMFATYFVMTPHSPAQFGAFPPLIIAFMYVLAGIWRGSRWIVAGLTIGVLTVTGYGLLKEHFLLWMSVVGGGALILGGLWLRRA